MHGTGEFTDSLNRKWKGEYRRGIFESRGQSGLVKDIMLSNRDTEIKKQITSVMDQLISLFDSDKNSVSKIVPYFSITKAQERFLKGNVPSFDERSP